MARLQLTGNTLVWGIFSVGMIALFAIWYLGYFKGQEPAGDPVGSDGGQERVPDFSLSTYEGETITPSDFPDDILVVNSWATWCPFCVQELPDFVRLQETFPDTVTVLAINREESLSTAQGYTDRIGISNDLVFLMDPDDTFYTAIGGFGMPETLFVAPDGTIALHRRGPMSFEEMKEHVEAIQADEPKT